MYESMRSGECWSGEGAMKGMANRWTWRLGAMVFVSLAAFFLVRGCAFMPWNSGGGSVSVRVTVCRDFGKEVLKDEAIEVREASSAMEALQAVAEVETAYGGGFIQAVDGVASQYDGGAGRKADWFFYVNGQMADVGARAYEAREGDWLLFDFHSWEYSMFTPVLAGCFPEPFVHGYGGSPEGIAVAYATGRRVEGEELAEFLASRSASSCRLVQLGGEWRPDDGEYALLVGTWQELAGNEMVAEGFLNHARLGLFAFFEGGELRLLDAAGSLARSVDGSAGLVQGLGARLGDGESALVVTGTDEAGLRRALDYLLGADSRAPRPVPGVVLLPGGKSLALPVGRD
ncbi:MAG: DUF4430 domain-containing protein [Actinobacteria bacterium]|nr:DUF4430 domain-containing protein [Actinomycetota bacterium]